MTNTTLDATDTPATRLRTEMAAVRLSFTWLGLQKTLSTEQKSQTAETFGADVSSLSASKKLLDTRHPAFRAVTGLRGRILSYWRGITLPYPEPGLRLIRQSDMAPFHERLTEWRGELSEAVEKLDDRYAELKETACQRLGELYQASDYPSTLRGLFAVDWEFPSVEPPSYLRELSPDLYRQEQARVAARFSEAVALAEEAFVAELQQLVDHLGERLSGAEDGRPKVFRDSAVEHLREFFTRFQQLNIGSSRQLEDLVAQAQSIVGNVLPQSLRTNAPLRQRVAGELSVVQAALEGLLVDRPRRAILRPARSEEAI